MPSRELLERHPCYRTAHAAFIDEILDVLSGQALAVEAARPEGLLEELTDAELRVLRYLPTNLSSAGIANEIYVSVNTVKTHMRTIYAKLSAHTRVEAVLSRHARDHPIGMRTPHPRVEDAGIVKAWPSRLQPARASKFVG